MRILPLLLLLPLACTAQTVTVPAKTVPTSSPTIPAGTTLCYVQKNGGYCTTSQKIPLPQVNVTVPAATMPVSIAGMTVKLSCTLASDGKFLINPDQTIAVTGLTCSLTK